MISAASSVARNVAEGWERSGKDKTHLYRVAAGSAREVKAGLQIAQAWGWLERRRARSHSVIALARCSID